MNHLRISSTIRFSLIVLALMLVAVPIAWAQDPNACDEPGDEPDVIVGDIDGVINYGQVGGISAFAFGTWSCNIGTCWLNWISGTNEHPVITMNMFRLMDGKFEQIGQSWLKHGFLALNNEMCTDGCIPTDGTHLGVNCADPYSASLNGQQSRLGPKFEVNAATGVFDYPYTGQGATGNAIYKRLQVHNEDLDPALNPGAQYFVESQYVSSDDTQAGNAGNSTSYRTATITESSGNYALNLTGATVREKPAIVAWTANDPAVKIAFITIPSDGLQLLAASAKPVGGDVWRYEYALENLTSHRSTQSFSVDIPPGGTITNIGFHDVDYHSGEPYSLDDWKVTLDTSSTPHRLVWSTDTYAVDPNANALRWGTLYNFRFDIDASPVNSTIRLGLFRPGTPAEIIAGARGPDTASVATPGESAGPATDQLIVDGYDLVTGEISMTYGNACETSSNNIYYGPLADVSNHGWFDNVCDIGLSGSYTQFDPGPDSYFFVIVGTKGVAEGSYGVDWIGAVASERADFPTNTCGQTQNLINRCD